MINMKIVRKPKKPKLGKALKKNLTKAKDLLMKVQTLVGQGKALEDLEIQQVLQDLQVLVQDVNVARVLMKNALEKVQMR